MDRAREKGKMKSRSRIYVLLSSGELQLIASALAFSTILSIIPFFATTLASIQYLYGLESFYPKIEKLVLTFFHGPLGTKGVLVAQKMLVKMQNANLGAVGVITLVLASVLLINQMERSFHRIWNLPHRRPLHRRIFLAWAFMIVFPAFLAIYTALLSLSSLGLIKALIPVSVINLSLVFLFIFLTFKTLPNSAVSNFAAAIGAGLGSLGLIILWKSFTWINYQFFHWNALYGGFAAIPTFLIWVLLFWYVILVAAAVTASLEKL